MSKESLFLIKPDKDYQQIAQEAVEIANRLGLTVRLIGEKVLTQTEAEALYESFKNEEWFCSFMQYLTSGEVRAYLTEGEEAIEKTLEVKRQVREKHARSRQENSIHSPKTEADSFLNIELFKKIFP